MAERNSSGHPTHIPFDGEIQLGSFVERLNRFAAQVDLNGEIHLAHVPNSGRMSELLVKGAEVGVVARTGSGRKTRWDLAIVKYGDVWVSVDSRQANEIVHRLLRSTRAAHREPGGLGRGWHQITAELTGVRREARVGRHIIDFLLEKRGSRAYLEVKSVNLVQNGTALFPDAPTKRGKEHVELLTSLCCGGEDAYLLFVVQRSDAKRCAPNAQTDPEFTLALRRAKEAGVMVAALSCEVSPRGVAVVGALPVHVP